ncbi:MAG TPA: GIY-YIG nuclease family protein [Gammaproteobacteria bacterium]|nr:GIY-YIG nuclease family protein [Gammaproteobacteria bacterium]
MQRLIIGKLGVFTFPPGHYVYTGSAKRNLASRVKRHLSSNKTLRWHVDYLLDSIWAKVVMVELFDANECDVNQQKQGQIIVPGFGASDCRQGCGSHLLRLYP